jgi:hypothetical protein
MILLKLTEQQGDEILNAISYAISNTMCMDEEADMCELYEEVERQIYA